MPSAIWMARHRVAKSAAAGAARLAIGPAAVDVGLDEVLEAVGARLGLALPRAITGLGGATDAAGRSKAHFLSCLGI